MIRVRRSVRDALRGEQGLSLTELVVAMSILSVVMLVFLTTMASIQRASQREDQRTQTNDQARLAVEQLDREVRSGNILYDPATEDPAGYVLRIYTQSNAPTRQPSPGYVCRLWRITDGGELQTRFWPPNAPDVASPWRVVANGIVNTPNGIGAGDPSLQAFTMGASDGARTLDVLLLVNANIGNNPNSTVRIQTAITGRNTTYGFPESVCATLPS